MFVTLLRVLFGFVVACLLAGVVMVAFVMPPTEIAALPEKVMYDRLGEAGILALAAATQSAMFAAPFALVAAAVAEWQGLRGVLFYALVGFAISGAGFVALFANELEGQATIVNTYASSAYALSGVVAGLAYWLLAGRYAGEQEYQEEEEPLPASLTPPHKMSRPAAAVPPARPTPAGPTSSTTPIVPHRRAQ